MSMKRTWRKNIQRQLQKENEDVQLFGGKYSLVWREGVGDNRLDEIKKKYVKWILKLDWRTPNYILVEETK